MAERLSGIVSTKVSWAELRGSRGNETMLPTRDPRKKRTQALHAKASSQQGQKLPKVSAVILALSQKKDNSDGNLCDRAPRAPSLLGVAEGPALRALELAAACLQSGVSEAVPPTCLARSVLRTRLSV